MTGVWRARKGTSALKRQMGYVAWHALSNPPSLVVPASNLMP